MWSMKRTAFSKEMSVPNLSTKANDACQVIAFAANLHLIAAPLPGVVIGRGWHHPAFRCHEDADGS